MCGLLALMLLHDSRRRARLRERRYVALDEQDRSRWDQAKLEAGLAAPARAVRFRRPGEYQLQAAITALHMEAGGTDWAKVAELYVALALLSPSPVVEVNRAAAVGFAAGPDAGLRLLEPLLADPRLERYQPLHAALRRRAGETAAAKAAYQRAIALTANAVERAELEHRLHALGGALRAFTGTDAPSSPGGEHPGG